MRTLAYRMAELAGVYRVSTLEIPPAWRPAAAAEGAFRWMTPDELVAVNREIEAVFERYRERYDPALRPPAARLVRLISVTLPMPENAVAEVIGAGASVDRGVDVRPSETAFRDAIHLKDAAQPGGAGP